MDVLSSVLPSGKVILNFEAVSSYVMKKRAPNELPGAPDT
jgi:hypothetical protein